MSSTKPNIKHLDVSKILTLGRRVATGATCDVYLGFLDQEVGRVKVAVKELRMFSHIPGDRLQTRFLREANLWKELKHPNIVPFLGYAIVSEKGPCLISLWCENGNLTQYLELNPGTDRLQLLLDVLYGMHYLDSRGVVHGDLKSLNILIDKDARACLCDFGTSRFLAPLTTGFTTSHQDTTGTRCFLSPERIQTDGPPTKASDVWAFGCVVIEVMTGQRPYAHIDSKYQIERAIDKGESPLNPSYDISITAAFSEFWGFVSRCWNVDPNHRPNIDQLLSHISEMNGHPGFDLAAMSQSPDSNRAESPGPPGGSKPVLGLPLQNSTSQERASLSIDHFDVSDSLTLGRRVNFGGFSDIYEGSLKRGDASIKVAIKELRVFSRVQEDRYQKHFLREVNVWKGLDHPNIVPFLGYSIDPESGSRLISLWYENGNLRNYLDMNPDAKRPCLLLDVLHGMRYLESINMVHGGLKSLNILVDSDGHACLCGFGKTRFLETVTGLTTGNQNTTGTLRFLSPERLQADDPPTIKSDIWAFGCIVIEVIARQRPYDYIPVMHEVYKAIIKRQLPLNPSYDISVAPGRLFWDFIKRCWKYDPNHRPTIDDLLVHIRVFQD